LTTTGDALNYIQVRLFSQSPPDAQKAFFVVTDGKSNQQKYNVRNEAYLLKRSGVEIFAFSIGSNVNDLEFTTMHCVSSYTNCKTQIYMLSFLICSVHHLLYKVYLHGSV